jgi:hypothetical protein
MGAGGGGAYLSRMGVREMDPGVAIQLLARALDSGQRMVTVADIDWDQFTPVFTMRRPSPLISALPEAARALSAAAQAATGHAPADGELARRIAGLPDYEQAATLTDFIRTETAAILGYPSLDIVEAGRPLTELGIDSLTAVELRNRLNRATGLRLSATFVFDYSTPAAMAAAARDQLAGPRDGARTGQPGQPETGDGDGDVRKLISSIPVGLLRSSGLLDELIELADIASKEDTTEEASIKDMSVEDLIRAAQLTTSEYPQGSGEGTDDASGH